VIEQLVVGAEKEVIRQGLALNSGHVDDLVGKLRLVFLFSRTGERSDQAALGKLADIIGNDLTDAKTAVLIAHGMSAGEDPGIELIFAMLNAITTHNVKKFRVQGGAIQGHVVGLEAADSRGIAHLDSLTKGEYPEIGIFLLPI